MEEIKFTEIVNNYDCIGNGFNAEVYARTDETVFRVSMTDRDGWRAICFLSPNERERFMLPRIYKWWIDAETDYLIAIVEKLEKINYNGFSGNVTNLEVFNRPGGPPKIDDVMPEYDTLYPLVKVAIALFYYCSERALEVKSLDLNYGNILKRRDGAWVLNDILGSRRIDLQ